MKVLCSHGRQILYFETLIDKIIISLSKLNANLHKIIVCQFLNRKVMKREQFQFEIQITF